MFAYAFPGRKAWMVGVGHTPVDALGPEPLSLEEGEGLGRRGIKGAFGDEPRLDGHPQKDFD